jgi:adenosylcobinamide-phosphate synthase
MPRAFAYGAVLGHLADRAFGDPRRGHPVAAFGRAAGAAERRLWRDDRGSGAVFTALCAGGAVAAAALASRLVRSNTTASVALTAAATWSVLGGTSLGREARAVGAALEAGDVEAARARLPHLCGRDPPGLDAVGGVPGLIGFRAVNTLDAMVGHRSPRYRRFGWAAARLDDIAGLPGSRLTAVLTVLAGPDRQGAWRVWRTDGGSHPSPNAGPVEASFAGALGVRLGGTLAYGGRVEHRHVLGAGNRPVEVRDIERAVRLSRRVGLLALAASAVASVGVRPAWSARGARAGSGGTGRGRA